MRKIHLLTLAVLFLCFQQAYSQVKLPRLISDGMILQRDAEVNIWGWAAPGEAVTVAFDGSTYETEADNEGNWSVMLPPQTAGGPYQMTFTASNEVTLSNVLFGDVWVCSGQSNMELTMERVKEKYREVVANAENDRIRQFLVPDRYDFKGPQEDVEEGSWISADPETILDFSAVAYFFAKDLYEEYQVPIGLINSALGGSPVEAWMSEEALKEFPEAYKELQKFKDEGVIDSIQASDKKRESDWYSQVEKKDAGLTGDKPWYAPGLDDSDWKTMQIPGFWADQGEGYFNGMVWFRKTVDLPASMAGRPADLWVGRIVDQDYTYVNGEQVGFTSYQYPPRRYTVDEGILREGENVLTVRVVNSGGRGGFVPQKPYFLAVDGDTIDLKGEWKYKVGGTMPRLQGPTFIRWKPGGLYNSMIAPLHNYAIKGVIWYQGESNTRNPGEYADAFPDMITDWRKNWGQGDFPFIFVQLANFMEEKQEPVESNWAALRQSQLNTLKTKNTGMAVTIDIGEWNDIHPLNKEDVGKRLALQARELAYGAKGLTTSGPIPAGSRFYKDRVEITFDKTGEGLMAKGDKPLQYFAVSNDGKHFEWAQAEIEGDTVVVKSKKVKNPTVVRYAWADNPASANLYNKEGLPATPFEVKK